MNSFFWFHFTRYTESSVEGIRSQVVIFNSISTITYIDWQSPKNKQNKLTWKESTKKMVLSGSETSQPNHAAAQRNKKSCRVQTTIFIYLHILERTCNPQPKNEHIQQTAPCKRVAIFLIYKKGCIGFCNSPLGTENSTCNKLYSISV